MKLDKEVRLKLISGIYYNTFDGSINVIVYLIAYKNINRVYYC